MTILPQFVVYAIRATYDLTYEYRYVGLTSNGSIRFKEHFREARNSKDARYNLPKCRWIRQKNFQVTFDILEVCDNFEALKLSEMKWIHILKSRGHGLLNLTDGGEGTLGWCPPESWREKQRKRTGSLNYMYGRRGELAPNYGKKRSDEFRKKNSDRVKGSGNPMYGIPNSKETKEKISLKTRGENNAAAKLTEDDVRAIRKLRDEGVLATELAVTYGVHRGTVDRIYKRLCWKHVV